jgi:hypothetical protein
VVQDNNCRHIAITVPSIDFCVLSGRENRAWCTSAMIRFAVKENAAVLFYSPNYEPFTAFPALENLTSSDSLHQLHQIIIRIISLLSLVQRNKKNLAPNKRKNSTRKTKKF